MLEDGVYFCLPSEEYHGDPALGSTDIRTLAYSPADYWHNSALNPSRPTREETPAQAFGTATHLLVLEGIEAFKAAYAPAVLDGRTKDGKAERDAIIKAGKIAMKPDDFNRVVHAAAVIRANPHLSEAFSGGMPEVSVFWTDRGIRKKARFDYLKLRSIVDLKSIRNTGQVDFPTACRKSIASWGYPVQAAHYCDGRAAMRALMEEDEHIHYQGVPCDLEWLQAVANSPFGFCFVFWQADNAPLTWATILSPGNPILDIARVTIDVAEENYRRFMGEFGPDRPWLVHEAPKELDIDQMPRWWGRGE